jgi:chromosome segregation ATPase
MATVEDITIPDETKRQLEIDSDIHAQATLTAAMERNNGYYREECERLFRWADDLLLSAEKELKDTKNQLRELNRQLRLAINHQERLDLELKIKHLSKKQREQRQKIFDVEDEITQKRDTLIDSLKARLKQKTQAEHLFMIRWEVV